MGGILWTGGRTSSADVTGSGRRRMVVVVGGAVDAIHLGEMLVVAHGCLPGEIGVWAAAPYDGIGQRAERMLVTEGNGQDGLCRLDLPPVAIV